VTNRPLATVVEFLGINTNSWEFHPQSWEYIHRSPRWLHAAHTNSQEFDELLGIPLKIPGMPAPHPPLTACSYYSFPGFITNSWELSSKSREHMSSRCVLVPLVPSIHTKSWESMHRVTSLVACWPRHSRDCYLIPGNFSHIPGNACTIPHTALSLVPRIPFLDGKFPVICAKILGIRYQDLDVIRHFPGNPCERESIPKSPPEIRSQQTVEFLGIWSKFLGIRPPAGRSENR
jgi:hypothetical protein